MNTDVRDHGSLVPDSHIGNVFALGQFCDVTEVAITSGIFGDQQIWLQANIKIHKVKRPLIFLATLLEPCKNFWIFFFKFDLFKAT